MNFEKLDTYEKLRNNQFLLKLSLHHRKELNLYFSKENNNFLDRFLEILINITLFWSIYSQLLLDIIEMYINNDFVVYLNLKF